MLILFLSNHSKCDNTVIASKAKQSLVIMKNYFVYILTNTNNKVFYTGMTNSLIQRVWEHKSKLIDGFNKKYNLDKIVYFESFNSQLEAIKREK